MNTEINNKIVACFIGETNQDNYNKDWNSLMRLVVFINTMNANKDKGRYKVIITSTDCKVIDISTNKILADSFGRYIESELLECIYNTLIDFINWHNNR